MSCINRCKTPAAWLLACAFTFCAVPARAGDARESYFEQHCTECHDADSHKGDFDLTSLRADYRSRENFGRWVKIYDRIHDGSMPPKKEPRPPAAETNQVLDTLGKDLTAAAMDRRGTEGRAVYRRMNRDEYQNTLRDLLDLPGLEVKDLLPDDGLVQGFDKTGTGLDISHVQLAQYLQAAGVALDTVIATSPHKPEACDVKTFACESYDFKIVLTNGDAILMQGKEVDPAIPIIREPLKKGLSLWEKEGTFSHGSATAVFRSEDCAFRPRFDKFAPIYAGKYRIRFSLWSFVWDKGQIKPSPITEAAAFKVGPRLLGYFDATSLQSKVHEIEAWMNPGEFITFNPASLKHVRVSERAGRTAEYTGPAVVVDWLEVEGPLLDQWPPEGHQRLFGDLPLGAFEAKSGLQPLARPRLQQIRGGAQPHPPKPVKGEPAVYTVISKEPQKDARRLLRSFMERAFRRPLGAGEEEPYLALVNDRLHASATFEEGMRTAYKAVLCSPDFLFIRVEPGKLDDHALAARLSYFLWSSMPDDTLTHLADRQQLHSPAELDRQVDRLLNDPRAERFIEHFLSLWLNLKDIDLTSPDRKLYPEFTPYLRDSMVLETQAFFRQMLAANLGVQNIVGGDFAMVNHPLATLYRLPGIDGSAIRQVALPPQLHRGGFLTQASILKVTANGTTTSPVKRGAWVLDKILGTPPDPPPPAIAAIDPDVRGTTTIRDQLEKHRADISCAACHAKIDPPGFALESFDVIGGFRTRYRSVGEGEAVTIEDKKQPYKLALPVDCTGKMADGRAFKSIDDFRGLLAADPRALSRNMASKLLIYSTGAEMDFADRKTIDEIVAANEKEKFGIRSLIHEVVRSDAFLSK
jgi:hypothetical protein